MVLTLEVGCDSVKQHDLLDGLERTARRAEQAKAAQLTGQSQAQKSCASGDENFHSQCLVSF
jgi:hypothetical protein